MPLGITEARQAFAAAITGSQFVQGKAAHISAPNDDALGEAAVVYCHWPLTEKGPYSNEHSREITVQITAGAANAFRQAQPVERGEMLTRLVHIFETRLLDGQYNELDPHYPPFIVHVYDHDLES